MANELRVRADYVLGTIDTALSASDTTLSSPALARLPAITSTSHAALALTDATAGVYEIVWVTAHTASATTATIARAKEGSTARAWASGAAWNHGPTAYDLGDRQRDAAFLGLGTASTADDEFRNDTLDPALVQIGTAASWAVGNDVLSVSATGIASGTVSARVKPFALAVGQSVETAARMMATTTGYTMAGPVVTDGTSGTSNIAWADAYRQSASITITPVLLTGTVSSIAAGGTGIDGPTGPQFFIRLTYVAANTFRMSFSIDGVSWRVSGADVTKAMTPTYVGVAVSTWGAGGSMLGSFEYLRVR